MTILGWIFLGTSITFVWGLTIWCFKKVLSYEEPPAEEVQHFHSA
jgi:hypothetical protein